MIFEERITTSSSPEVDEEDEELIDDECDHQSTDGHLLELSPKSAKQLLHKQLCLSTDGQHWSTTSSISSSLTPLSDDSSLSSLSVCCSPVSRMSSPSPTTVCAALTHSLHSPPSSLTSIRNAVSHLTRLDDFNVVKLSQGFFSQVFKVTHHSSKKVMVLKMNKQAGNRGNALKEIELLNKLNHENIVAFMGTVVHEGGLHPLLEYINGGTLEKLIRQYYKIDTYFDENKRLITRTSNNNNNNINNNISLNNNNNSYNNNNIYNSKYNYCPQIYRLNDVNQTFIKLAEDIARGMDYLHSLQFLHRDLTSKNILIRKLPPICEETDEYDAEPYLVAVIGDFGFATSEPTKDQKLPTVGSPYWLAPESIKGQWYNHKCDIFSYGIICCELNWRIPADPDYLCRDDSFLINFDKLPALPKDTLLARIARLCCQKNGSIRPEFSEILEIFETEIMNDKNGFNSKMRYILRRDLSLSSSNYSFDSMPIDGSGDIFDQHLIRRRNSQIERKYFNGCQR